MRPAGLRYSKSACELVSYTAGLKTARPRDSGQIPTLRRDSSMADRRALSLSFFRKPCGHTDRCGEKRSHGDEHRKQDISSTGVENVKQRNLHAENPWGTDLAGASSFTIQETVPVLFSVFFPSKLGLGWWPCYTDVEETVPVHFGGSGHSLHFGANSRWLRLHAHLLVGALSVRMGTISCTSFRLSRGPDVTYLKLHCCLCFVSAHRLFYYL